MSLQLLYMQVTCYLSRLNYTASGVLVPGSILDFQTPYHPLVLSIPWEDAASGCEIKESTIIMCPATEMPWLFYIRNLIMCLNPSEERVLLSMIRRIQSTSCEDILSVSKKKILTMRSSNDALRPMSNVWWKNSGKLSVLIRPRNMPQFTPTIRLI